MGRSCRRERRSFGRECSGERACSCEEDKDAGLLDPVMKELGYASGLTSDPATLGFGFRDDWIEMRP
jgi:hypothetical protein